jgi:hypothetical protein
MIRRVSSTPCWRHWDTIMCIERKLELERIEGDENETPA